MPKCEGVYGHCYELLPIAGLTPQEAQLRASMRRWNGQPGYLATYTTALEMNNTRQTAALACTQTGAACNVWLGGGSVNGQWQWLAGPEANMSITGAAPSQPLFAATFTGWCAGFPSAAAGPFMQLTSVGAGSTRQPQQPLAVSWLSTEAVLSVRSVIVFVCVQRLTHVCLFSV